MGTERELVAEQEFLDQAYARLDAMRADANAMLEGVLDLGKGGTFQSRTERDVIVRTSLARLEQLDIGDQALAFGRIDRLADDGAEDGADRGAVPDGHAGPDGRAVEVFHIGRLAIHGSDHEPLVVDWRAPIAEPFYRATGRDPQGLTLRRHLAIDGRRVVGVEDERFGPEPVDGGTVPIDGEAVPGDGAGAQGNGSADGLILGDVPIGGPAALLAALGRARSGRMTDIVGTIQREQDEIIRSPLPGVLLVQGGPGTGKTAVALHRAAYLLYTHRFPLERQGVLVVGPNPLFLRYIEQVLPSLGETGVTLSTVAGLVPEIRVSGAEPAPVAELKGDPRMAKLIARAVRTRQRPLRHDVAIPYGALLLRLTAAETREIVETARRRPGTHNARRKLVTQAVVGLLAERARSTQQTLGAGLEGVVAFPGYEDPSELGEDGLDLEDFSRKVRRVPELVDTLDRMWPRLSPHELLHDLFGARPLIAAAAGRSFTADEQALLYRPRSSSLDEVDWTAADAALVDEARHLLGPRTGGPEEAVRNYGHIVVDEVQDLSPMQLRMLTRRSLSGSMTVVGDIAQATAPWAPKRWTDITQYLPNRRPARMVELTVSYRTPAEVLDVASRVLAAAAPELRPPRPVRRTGMPPRLVVAAGGGGGALPEAPGGELPLTAAFDGATATREELATSVAQVAREELAAVGPGRVAVLAPEELLPLLSDALEAAGLPAVDPRQRRKGGLSEPLVLLPVDAANGLEFDGVVVVEPGVVAGGTSRGLRTLYVALTRPTQRLAVVMTTPPPAALAPDELGDRGMVAVAD